MDLRNAIRQAFLTGQLKTEAVDPISGQVGLYPIQDVLKHHTGDRPSVTCETLDGRKVTTTCDHSLFQMAGHGIQSIPADQLQTGDEIVSVEESHLVGVSVAVAQGDPLETSYDLSVPGPENFVLTNGIVAHNSYSIGGVSLDINKSDGYMDLKRNAEEQWDKLTEAKSRTTKFMRGLKQPRFGVGVRSAFGPATGRGVLTPRSFV